MTPGLTILHEDGRFRLYATNKTDSLIAHHCENPKNATIKWWYLPSPHRCYMCGAVPPDNILGLYKLHNWDRLRAVK